MRSLAFLFLACFVVEARAEIPVAWMEPDEETAREIVAEWRTAVRDKKTDALEGLALSMPGSGPYVQVTVPKDAALAKKCRKPSISSNVKAVRANLKCLLTPDLVAAISAFDPAKGATGTLLFAEKLSEVLVDGKEWKAAQAQLKKLDKHHVFVNISGVPGDGVWHQLVLAISTEMASSSNRVGAVVHWTTPRN